jgi:hypothetical protein
MVRIHLPPGKSRTNTDGDCRRVVPFDAKAPQITARPCNRAHPRRACGPSRCASRYRAAEALRPAAGHYGAEGERGAERPLRGPHPVPSSGRVAVGLWWTVPAQITRPPMGPPLSRVMVIVNYVFDVVVND